MAYKELNIQNKDTSLVDIEQATPMMRQFLNIKRENKGILLLYRMGDFYETFFEDAITAAEVLEITLTARDAGGLGKVPMAGIPCKALENYMPRLLEKGIKVAVCEQVEDPALAKGLVERQVVRTLTAGTITEPYMLNAKQNNFLAALINDPKDKKKYGIAYVDVSTGDFKLTELTESLLFMELNRINPSELLLPSKKVKPNEFQLIAEEVPEFSLDISKQLQENFSCTLRSAYCFNLADGIEDIKRVFKVKSLEAFGCNEYKLGTMAVSAIINYIEDTQKDSMPSFDVIVPYNISKYVSIDNITRKNLELTKTSRDGSYKGSLLHSIDRTKTPMGGRLIRQWIEQPLQDVEEINYRLNSVDEFVQNRSLACNISDIISRFNDIERISSRITNNSVNARELIVLKDSLLNLPALASIVQGGNSPFLKTLSYVPDKVIQIAEEIDRTIKEDPPAALKDGNIIKPGYSEELDEYRNILSNCHDWVGDFEKNEKLKTGIRSLKVSYNKTFGYYIEVTHSNTSLVPEDYIRKQTLTNAERYITPELKEFENKVLNAQTKTVDLEYSIFIELREKIKEAVPLIRSIAKAIAVVDVLLSLAEIATEYNYCKPIVDEGKVIDIIGGRHPVIEQIVPMGSYVPNDICMDSGEIDDKNPQIIILTGPNMAGKSTYMRQKALIVILAQIGSFTPAEYARIGLIDKIFARVGAVDDLATGQSTFMVEMNETALIVNSATERSLILLDEIGRGTSTFDGVAIAWSVTEYIAKNLKAKTIFATHYHELNVLEKTLPNVRNFRVTVSEQDGNIEFLHKVVPGGASRSYGIQVAKMAGLPNSIISRAELLMNKLLKEDSASISTRKKALVEESPQLSLF